MAETTRTLYCKAGDHEWEREVKRGRVPENCPEHNQKVVEQGKSLEDRLREGREKKSREIRQKAIEEILNKPQAASCKCGIDPTMTVKQIRKIRSCTDPYFVCPVLDKVLRAIGE